MQAIGIIPARYGSTRFPGKALALLGGVPMIQRVYEQASRAKLDAVFVATDDKRIAQAVERFGGQAVLTSAAHSSGTERVAEAARPLDARVIVNIQGDEPLVHPQSIDQIVEFLLAHQAVPMATVMTPLASPEELARSHTVKVVVDQDGYALYFSRSPIPFVRTPEGGTGHGARGMGNGMPLQPLPPVSRPSPLHYKHLGLYGYQRHFLMQLPHLPPTPLEQAEQLEQLRVLEHGHKIKVLLTPHDTVGVDTPEDLARVETMLAGRNKR